MQLYRPCALAVAAIVCLALVPTVSLAAVNVNWSLLSTDPYCPHRPGCHEQLHKVYLQAGTTYVIFMNSSQFDTYLFLENLSGQVLAKDDDSGGNLNARIVFTPSVTGHYNIVATSYAGGATGAYTISVTP